MEAREMALPEKWAPKVLNQQRRLGGSMLVVNKGV